MGGAQGCDAGVPGPAWLCRRLEGDDATISEGPRAPQGAFAPTSDSPWTLAGCSEQEAKRRLTRKQLDRWLQTAA